MSNRIDNNLSDKQLVSKVLHGYPHAFSTIIKNTESLVAQIVYKMIAHAEERRDIVQDIYLKAFKSLTGFRFQSKLSTWIAQISYNTCLNHIEKKMPQLIDDFNYRYNGEKETPDFAHHHSSLVSPSIVEAVISQKQLSKILTSELENLPPVYKTLICLYHQEEMRYEEISKITALPIGTVKSYLFRARKLLKENILSKYKREEL